MVIVAGETEGDGDSDGVPLGDDEGVDDGDGVADDGDGDGEGEPEPNGSAFPVHPLKARATARYPESCAARRWSMIRS